MKLTTEQYLALSALAYKKLYSFPLGDDKNSAIKKIPGIDYSKPEFSALASLKDWIVLDVYSNNLSGFYGIAIQDPTTKDIVFAYRGTQANILGGDVSPSDIFTDIQIGLGTLPQQFVDAANFYRQVRQTYGSQYLIDYSFTGHSLGGAIAQFMTYSSATDDKIYNSVTFNAVSPVPVIKSIDDDFDKKWNRFYDHSTDHVNSLDWVGMYHGADLGKTIRHINNTEVDYRRVNFEAVSKMLLIKLQISKGIISRTEGYKQIQKFIKNINNAISNGSDGYSIEDTLTFYRGQAGGANGELGGGFLNFSHHYLHQFLRDDSTKPGFQYSMTSTVGSQYGFVNNDDLLQFINALSVVERARSDDSIHFSKIKPSSTLPPSVYSSGGVLYVLPDGAYSWGSYSDASVAYAKYIVQKYERRLISGEFMKSYIDMQKAQAEQNRRIDPLVFDLGGDGITTVSLEESNAFFDLDNNGFAEKTSWVSAKEGLLAYDKNGDGIINGGNELFGDRTLMEDGKTLASSGFAALAEYDDNKDGKIDRNDAIYTLLRIWQDADGDGIASAGELKQLVDLGIVSVGLSYSNTGVTDSANNIQVRTGTFTLADGSSRIVGEYLLNRNPVHSVDSSPIEISDSVALLPNVQGAGNVGSLHKAIMQDKSGSLRGLVEQFITEKDVAKREALTEDILAHWAGVDSIDPKSRGDAFDARKLAVLEKFFGAEFQGSPNANSAPLLKSSYAKLFEVVYVSLISQAQLKDIVNSVADDNDEISFEKAKQVIDAAIAQDPVVGSGLLGEFARAMKYYGLKSSKEFAVLRGYYAGKSAEYGRIIDFAGEQVLRGTANGESLSVGDLYTLIDGDAGDDTLWGDAGNDTLIGGQGNDSLRGGEGNDILHGNEGQDVLYGNEGDDILHGDAGNDELWGGVGNDTLIGGRGNDILEGCEGDDVYIFNKGDGEDEIVDNSGTDTIKFGQGINPEDIVVKATRGDFDGVSLELSIKNTDDKITIREHFADNNQVENIMFANGVTWSLEEISKRAHTMYGTADDDYIYSFDDEPITVHGLDGNDALYGSVANDLLYGDAGDDTLWGDAGNDTLIGGQGNDSLRGGEGNDILHGNEGQDVLYGNEGDDILHGDAGNDELWGGVGNDTLIGGRGNDILEGCEGDDVYIFNKGDGEDTVCDVNGKADEIRLGHESIGVVFERVNNDLHVRMPGSLDAITISSWYSGDNYKIETFKSATGSTITHTQIENLIQAMSSFQKDTGMTWEQALTTQPSQVQAIVQEYWTVPGV